MSKVETLKDCCSFQEGYVNPSQKYREYFGGNIKWLRASDLNGFFVYDTEKTLSQKGFESAGASALMFKKDTLAISKSGTIGTLGILKDEMCGNRAVINIDVDKTKADLYYIFYLLKYKNKELVSKAHGSIQKNLYISVLEKTKLNHSDLSTQQKIAAVLTALDAKIELNARINAELEQVAKTLYDYWFVQFAPHKSAGGEMVWNEALKREIPKDWKVENIENCCDIVDCLHAKKPDYEFEDEKYYLLQLENIRDDGLLDLTNKYYVPKDEYQKWISRIEITEDDILITNAGRVAATAQVPKGIKTGIGRNITAIRPKSVSPTYLFSFFRSSDMIRQVRWNMDAGAFFSSLNVKGIKKLHIIRPSGDIEEQFENIIKPMRRKREELNVESQTLTELRDWLLPMLMNGQVTIQTSEV